MIRIYLAHGRKSCRDEFVKKILGERSAYIHLSDGGKPYIAGSSVHFNLSHSGEWLAMAVGPCSVGIDLQQIVPVHGGVQKMADRFYTAEDAAKIRALKDSCDAPGDIRTGTGISGNNRNDLFFRVWTIREAYIKFTGEGLRRPLNSFSIDWEHRAVFENGSHVAAYFHEYSLPFPGYHLCVCTKDVSMLPENITQTMEFRE